ncbi:putative quinol monooxygenase [Terriglobus albidus]|uniref:putative quinol monooxygenase n=1 Tax=Terriglobus albidus TaxID=1592106 RepID=UPI0021DF98E7|nr:antibiotic biosynthesis monooxygenase [Terriglobus albidus]
MKTKTLTIAAVAMLAGMLALSSPSQATEMHPERLVRLAELEIDAAQLTAYRAALREEIETSVRVEPGVLALYAVAVKDHPNQIRLFEMYANQAAYQAHLQSMHFKKYKGATAEMVKSLRLIETEPLLLKSK